MSGKCILTDEQQKEIVTRYKNGEKKADLAREYHVCFGTVVNTITRLTPGESFRNRQGRGEALTTAQKEWAYEQYCNGYTQAEIAEALFCDISVISHAIAGRPRIKKPLHYDFKKEGVKHGRNNTQQTDTECPHS